MSATKRLQELQSALVARGVRDVKFCFALKPEKASSEVASDVADFLSAYVEGRYKHATIDDAQETKAA